MSSGTPALDAEDRAAMARLGVSQAQLDQATQARQARATVQHLAPPVLARHLWPAVMLAGALQTQVRAVASGLGGLRYLGLDYARLDGTKRDLGLPLRGPKATLLLQQFQVVESEMLKVWNSPAAEGST